ncbi:MAG: RsbRD N-terminal domain-containing protein [Desulfobacterales bacterium]
MRISDILARKKSRILEEWFKTVIETYAQDTAHFLKNQKDPFANPVGSNIVSGLTSLLEFLINPADNPDVDAFIDKIIRIRAVQTMFSPSQATKFIFDVKKIIRNTLEKELHTTDEYKQLAALEDHIDFLALKAFDIFVGCREKIYELKANQEKRRMYTALERAGLITGVQGGESQEI